MVWLVFVSLVWAFSFGLIPLYLKGVEPALLGTLRLLLALPLFLPFWRWQGLSPRDWATLLAIGAVQYGLMYCFYLLAFLFLPGWQVALFTVFTPFFVAALAGGQVSQRGWAWLAVGQAVAGAFLVYYNGRDWGDFGLGFGLMQLSNLCFAWGQVQYRQWRRQQTAPRPDVQLFALPLLGGVLVSVVLTTTSPLWAPEKWQGWAGLARLTPEQWLVTAYLGVVASGLGFFGWNYGAARSTPATLAVANNLKIPLAVVVGLTVFGQPWPSWWAWLGIALVLAAQATATWAEWRSRARATTK